MQKIVRLAYELPDHPGYLGLFAALLCLLGMVVMGGLREWASEPNQRHTPRHRQMRNDRMKSLGQSLVWFRPVRAK